jgi:poly(3-hydroxybutyrate) depolymerase
MSCEVTWLVGSLVILGAACGPHVASTAGPATVSVADTPSLDAVCLSLEPPAGVLIDPGRWDPTERAAGLQVVTFSQSTAHCGEVVRRYLLYAPRALKAPARAAVILLHGLGASAESFRDFQTHASFERLANEHGFLVVYANAAPSSASHPKAHNSGGWRAGASESVIDDVAYLDTVVTDLKQRGHLASDGRVFLAGQSNGGGMVLKAARHRPGAYAGIAAFMPFVGLPPEPPSGGEVLPPLLLAYSDRDPGLPAGYANLLRDYAYRWATAMSADGRTLADTSNALPDRTREGAAYEGSEPAMVATRDSRVTQADAWAHAPGREPELAVRVLRFDRAGHFWPYPEQDTADWALRRWGFRNQDLDASDACWSFFSAEKSSPSLSRHGL